MAPLLASFRIVSVDVSSRIERFQCESGTTSPAIHGWNRADYYSRRSLLSFRFQTSAELAHVATCPLAGIFLQGSSTTSRLCFRLLCVQDRSICISPSPLSLSASLLTPLSSSSLSPSSLSPCSSVLFPNPNPPQANPSRWLRKTKLPQFRFHDPTITITTTARTPSQQGLQTPSVSSSTATSQRPAPTKKPPTSRSYAIFTARTSTARSTRNGFLPNSSL